jgi:hypothetical protein
MEKVHCMSLSSIHIHYNHSPVQALNSLYARCEPFLISIGTEVVTTKHAQRPRTPGHARGVTRHRQLLVARATSSCCAVTLQLTQRSLDSAQKRFRFPGREKASALKDHDACTRTPNESAKAWTDLHGFTITQAVLSCRVTHRTGSGTLTAFTSAPRAQGPGSGGVAGCRLGYSCSLLLLAPPSRYS